MRRHSSVKFISVWNRRLSLWVMLGLLGLSLCWMGWRSAQAVADTWTIKAPMPTPRSMLAAAAIGGKLYAVGGDNGSTSFDTLEVYDPATDTWATKASMSGVRASLAADAINGQALCGRWIRRHLALYKDAGGL